MHKSLFVLVVIAVIVIARTGVLKKPVEYPLLVPQKSIKKVALGASKMPSVNSDFVNKKSTK